MVSNDGEMSHGVYKKIRDIIQQPHKHKHRKVHKKQTDADSRSSVHGDSVRQVNEAIDSGEERVVSNYRYVLNDELTFSV